MPPSPLVRIGATVATAIGLAVAAGAPALASGRDTTPPTAPFLAYAQGYYCGVLIVGMDRATDNVTPQPQLKYEVFVDGAPFGPAVDQGSESGVWAWFQGPSVPGPVLAPGPHTVTVKAQDAAGNWSRPSNADPVTGYAC
ncbi:MAG TPA: hypothetical protein VGJ50_06215 [Streptosporangiaceae bacterium]|jgi:hypothetical protein